MAARAEEKPVAGKQKLIVLFDVDHTLFDSYERDSIVWTDSAEKWQDLCNRLRTIAEKFGHEVVFGLLSSKDTVDELVDAAILQLHEFFQQSTSYMRHEDGSFSYAVDLDGCLFEHHVRFHLRKFEVLSPTGKLCVPLQSTLYLVSHQEQPECVVAGFKTSTISRILETYQIEAPSLFFIDDTPENLRRAKELGVTTISAKMLNNRSLWNVWGKVDYIHTRIKMKFIRRCYNLLSPEMQRTLTEEQDSLMRAYGFKSASIPSCPESAPLTPALVVVTCDEAGENDDTHASTWISSEDIEPEISAGKKKKDGAIVAGRTTSGNALFALEVDDKTKTVVTVKSEEAEKTEEIEEIEEIVGTEEFCCIC